VSERIFLTYTNASAIPYQGATLGHHIVLNYIDSDGEHYTLQGMPEHKFDRNAAKLIAFLLEEGRPGGGANNTDSLFQRLRAEQRDSKTSNPSTSLPTTLIAEGDDLRSQWERMTKFGDEVNTIGYKYRPVSQNSNSFAAGALRRGGFLGPGTVLPEIFDRLFAIDPASGQTYRMEVRGFDQHLANPLDKTALPLQRSGTPFVPANARAAGNGQEAFDRRFGSAAAESANPNLPAWMRDLGEMPRDIDRKPVRYLGRRVAGQPEASTFDVGAPVVPLAPPNDVLSPDRPSSLDNRFGSWTASPAGITPRNPNLPLPPAEPGRPPVIFSGKPMPLWAMAPMQQPSARTEAPDGGIRLASPANGIGGVQAPAIDTRGSAPPLAPSVIIIAKIVQSPGGEIRRGLFVFPIGRRPHVTRPHLPTPVA
jgi:hypothetical protein